MSETAEEITMRAPPLQYSNTDNGSITSLKSHVPMTPTHSTATKTNGFGCERRSSLRRNLSYGNILAANEAKVLVIYTGGTIGMMRNDKDGEFNVIKYLFYLSNSKSHTLSNLFLYLEIGTAIEIKSLY